MRSFAPRVRRTGWRPLARDRRGVAVLEFALMSPALILLLMGLYDLSSGWITWRRLTTSAEAVGQVATMLAVQSDSTNALTYNDASRASTAAFAVLPQLFSAPVAEYAVTLTEVTFASDKTCASATDYCRAKVLWSKTFQGGGPTRPCAYLNRVPDTAPPAQNTLPASAFQANPLLVVDAFYTFHPLFLNGFVGVFPLRWAAYFPSRSGLSITQQTIFYNDASSPGAQCP